MPPAAQWNTAGNWSLTPGADNGVVGIPDNGDSAVFASVTPNLNVSLANPVVLTDLSFNGTATGYNVSGSYLAISGTYTQGTSGNTIASHVIAPGALNVQGSGNSTISGDIYDGAFQGAESTALGVNGNLLAIRRYRPANTSSNR